MSIALTAAIKILELAVSAIESAIKSYDAATGTDLISEIESHFGKLAIVLADAKKTVNVVNEVVNGSDVSAA